MKTSQIMNLTLLALLPGTGMYAWHFGTGILLNLLICAATAMITDYVVLKLRGRKWHLDHASLVTALLLGLCLPPLLPLWMAALATVFALLFGKHMYGGTGHNVFNPAMVGYAMLIVSFPLAMSFWPATAIHDPASLLEIKGALTQELPGKAIFDGVTSATPLDDYKFREATTNQEYFTAAAQDNFMKWVWINAAFLLGGLMLIYLKVISWQGPAAFLGTLVLLAVVFYDGGSSASLGSPAFHLMTGATMLAAFFIITDPVSRPTYPRGILVFAVGVALITFIIRTIGGYPEGVAFAVLLMNATAPVIDQFFQTREITNEAA